ncbi:MAG: AbrB/MazE/SpoVT family DNA-binding domain-containing protein [Candidatus Microthrix sp.]|uniref:AbrB/MazE/SpoVT family DNA-binding domain-containing protein n=1 Tax=Candidatus Neomicrothrix subdominans TaxID=2954438 RepID=A0A936NDK8_9ACTN|nr:AbrB/MazE/SpoVT family DNA-binding domain-containing protein [Candidatus Microthrix sp.]MBK9297684.1 AbrB/MazE/SpoVT family DNA-binding domain-containing protein [Candidatus Microthrix subdominans]MBK6312429.1 AbrB/MazE/SpoVT family DNA-binding domain-containing protein [Candidatus Microthrix sp.]MBK6437478.1 AbrB/MazE/SpoVT family DNA-binding domain-containing protein [Candidatus Microthrix sp.]MBK6969905.1 AbrB/MazE/SpoVT family DNA-binding domain-containing protein [Candidatus Microthrix 
MVIPKQLRDVVGLVPGKVEVTVDGAALRIEPLVDSELDETNGLELVDGRLVIPASGMKLDDALVDEMRRADQR